MEALGDANAVIVRPREENWKRLRLPRRPTSGIHPEAIMEWLD